MRSVFDRFAPWLRRSPEGHEHQPEGLCPTPERLSCGMNAAEALATANTHRLEQLSGEVGLLRREMRLLLDRLEPPNREAWTPPDEIADPSPAANAFPHSTVCRHESFDQAYFHYWTQRMGEGFAYHRKLWEFVFILQALWERGAIRDGARGLGFGVGRERLPAVFASEGCEITATDMDAAEAAKIGWNPGTEHAAGLDALRYENICPTEVFDQRTRFRVCDMNQLPDDLVNYDFCWSSCAFEHLGSLEHGAAFVERSIHCLRPGGWAVHTTEFNISSNSDTLKEGQTVLYRERDLRDLVRRLEDAGHNVAPLDLAGGDQPLDGYIDVPPYRPQPHLKLAIAGYACTSVGLIIQRKT